jgi:hypothetical protein
MKIRKSRCTTYINYTGGKFAAVGINDTGSHQHAAGVVASSGNLSSVSTILAANLLPVSTSSVAICHWYQ